MPPREYASALLEVARGCTWNRCLFCNLYRGVEFEPVPLAHIVKDLDEIAEEAKGGRAPKRVFLLDGNVAGVPNGQIPLILDVVRQKPPSVREIGGYIRTGDIKLKSDAELAELAEPAARGLTGVTVGAECG